MLHTFADWCVNEARCIMTLSVPTRWLANPNCESQALVATRVHSTKAQKIVHVSPIIQEGSF